MVEADEADTPDAMTTSLEELPNEKGEITREEWVQRIKKNLKS